MSVNTVETTHRKMIDVWDKLNQTIKIARVTTENIEKYIGANATAKRVRAATSVRERLDAIARETAEAYDDYRLSTVGPLNDYYTSANESESTQAYYLAVGCGNFAPKINCLLKQVAQLTLPMEAVSKTIPAAARKGIMENLKLLNNHTEAALRVDLSTPIEKCDSEVCSCGQRMEILAETSEMRCPSPICGEVMRIVGIVFRNDQFYPQEVQKTKHGDYDTTRHFRFWLDRIQACENKEFSEGTLSAIDRVLTIGNYDRKTLTCRQMRRILKDPKVKATHLNDHIPLLVKTFGGPSPPTLSFGEVKLLTVRFGRAMELFEKVRKGGKNLPYYPCFIMKILEEMFKDDEEKRKILYFINLQSRDTVVKNDIYFKNVCSIADEEDGLVYRPTDPAMYP